MASLESRMDAHEQQDEKRFAEFHGAIREIKENHLAHIEKDINELQISFSALNDLALTNKTNIEWLKWLVMTATGAGIIAAITSIATLFRG